MTTATSKPGRLMMGGELARRFDEGLRNGRSLASPPGQRNDRRFGVSYLQVPDLRARFVPGDGGRHEANASTGSDEREDLLNTAGLEGNASRQAVPALLGEPSRRCVLVGRHGVDDEVLARQIREFES